MRLKVRNSLKNFLGLCFFGIPIPSGVAYGQNLLPESLIIDYDGKKSEKIPDKKAAKAVEKDFKNACNNLGKAMLLGKGPCGVGIFSSFSCSVNGKKISGKVSKAVWKMSIINKKSGSIFDLKKGETPMANLNLPYSETSMMVLRDPELIDLIAYQLLEQMPYAIYINAKKVKEPNLTVTFRHWQTSETKSFKYKVPDPPSELTIYTLQWDQEQSVYRTSILGVATLKQTLKPKVQTKKVKGKSISYLKGGSVIYTIPKDVLEQLKKGPAWAHSSQGPGANNEELTKFATNAKNEIDGFAKNDRLEQFLAGKTGLVDNFLESAASGHVGIRYGLQVLPAEGELGRLLDDTSLFNLVAEFRGGPLKGVRYYYDKLPESKMNLNGSDGGVVKARLAFARHVIGYSWDFQFPFLIDRITVDPKIGVWTFNAFLPVSQDENGLVTKSQEFNLGSTATVAIEIGGEIIGSWYTLRGFYANDAGFSLIKQGARVVSNRFGGDAFFKAGPTFTLFEVPFKTALLGSFIYESVSIRRGVGEIEDGNTEITGIVYSVGYAQGGVAISW